MPRTATRKKAPSFGKLLERIEPHAESAYDFYGKLIPPGKTIEEHELWPTSNYPAIPVYLETCQICFEGKGHRRNPYEYILWIWQVRNQAWRQVARVSAHRPEEWIAVLLPVALRLVTPKVEPPEPDLRDAARRIASLVEYELFGVVDNRRRAHLLQLTHDYLCQRSADMGETRKLYQIPLRPIPDFFADLLAPTSPDIIGFTVKESEAWLPPGYRLG